MNVYDDIKPSAIQIDDELRDLIPAITADEREQLEHNIIAHGGARDPLVVWLAADDTWILLDGHNRYEICTRLGLRFSVAEARFDTREQAADWIDRNQLGRRNLTDDGRKLLLGRVYNRAKKSEHDGGKGKKRSGGQSDRHSEKTSERIAREHNVSEATVRRAGKFQQAVEKLNLQGDIINGTVHASEKKVIEVAAALADNPTPDQLKAARNSLKKRPKKKSSPKAKGKQKSNRRPATATNASDFKANAAPAQLVGIEHEIEAASREAWQRLKDEFPPDEHSLLRKTLAAIIRDEQKQFDSK